MPGFIAYDIGVASGGGLPRCPHASAVRERLLVVSAVIVESRYGL